MSLLLELLQVSLGSRDSLSRTPSAAEWAVIFTQSQRQVVLGVTYDSLERLPKEQLPPKEILLQWIGFAQINEKVYKLQVERAEELTKRFQKNGFRSCLLKGLGFAQLYPTPSRRTCGDIDLWMDGKREDVMRWLRGKYEIEHVVWHHIDAKIFDDVETEIHYHPCWMYNPFCNHRLQKWFNAQASQQMVINEKLGFGIPSVTFSAVYSLVHSFHHLIEEGLGLRHVVDYYYILKALPTEERPSVVNLLTKFGLFGVAKALMWVLKEVCGMSDDYLICEPDEKKGRFLLDEIMRGGNFGHYRNDNRKRNSAARMFALLPYFPKEVLWVVPWKLWHKCWRLFNR